MAQHGGREVERDRVRRRETLLQQGLREAGAAAGIEQTFHRRHGRQAGGEQVADAALDHGGSVVGGRRALEGVADTRLGRPGASLCVYGIIHSGRLARGRENRPGAR